LWRLCAYFGPGALTIGGEANFQGDTLFGKLATFLGETVFQGRVNFVSAPTFGSDTAGFASIEKGAKKVRVSFETPYEHQPIVAVTLIPTLFYTYSIYTLSSISAFYQL
jgi:hypothetical protein